MILLLNIMLIAQLKTKKSRRLLLFNRYVQKNEFPDWFLLFIHLNVFKCLVLKMHDVIKSKSISDDIHRVMQWVDFVLEKIKIILEVLNR